MNRPQNSSSFVVVAPDTDMGKSHLSALLLHASHAEGSGFGYWKPLQSGPPDTAWIDSVTTGIDFARHAPLRSYDKPASVPIAAAAQGEKPPTIREVIDAGPDLFGSTPFLVETAGGPLSPIDDGVPQTELLKALDLPCLLVAKNRVGAITSTASCFESLRLRGLEVTAIVLIGPEVEGNIEALRDHTGCRVERVDWPSNESSEAFAERAKDLQQLAAWLAARRPSAHADTASLRSLDKKHVWHPYSPLDEADDRPLCRRAQGEWLELDTGERLVDGISSWWTCIHGHGHPRLARALASTTERLDHVIFAGLSHEPGIQLSTDLLDCLPDRFERVFLSESGSIANEIALKIVLGGWRRREKLAPGERQLWLTLEGGYHGDTFGTMSIGRDPVFFAEWEGQMFEVAQIPMTLDALADANERYGTRLAGLILEPMLQAAGGMRIHAPDDVRAFCESARRLGLPVVFDEVMTGFGRTGTQFALEQIGFEPDLITLGKGLSGGILPLSAAVVSADWCDPWAGSDRSQMLFHGTSFTGNPLACASGIEGLKMFREGAPLEGAKRLAERASMWAERDWGSRVRDPRACGTVFAFDLVDDAPGYLSDRRSAVIQIAREHGVLLRPLGSVVYSMPPLCTGEEALARIERALSAIAAQA